VKRSAAIVTLAFVLALVGGAAFLTSTLPCPDCRLGTREQPSPNQQISPNCPRCEDAGRVSRFNRGFRRGLDPDVALLFDGPYLGIADNPSRFGEAFERLVKRAGNSMEIGFDYGSAVFLGDGEERLPAAFVCSIKGLSGLGDSTCRVLLFDPAGTLLDSLELTVQQARLDASWKASASSGRELHVFQRGASGAFELIHGDRRGTFAVVHAVVVRVERGKLVVVPGGARS
jgi:hypothetical protein